MGRSFAWQRGFGVFGVSASNLDVVVRYIQTQEAPPQDDVRARVYRLVKEPPSCIQSAIRIRLKILCRAYGSPPCFFLLTHGGAVGYPLVAPTALDFSLRQASGRACAAALPDRMKQS